MQSNQPAVGPTPVTAEAMMLHETVKQSGYLRRIAEALETMAQLALQEREESGTAEPSLDLSGRPLA